MLVGTTVVHARRKNRHWSISGPEAVPELAGRSGSSGAGDIRKRCGVGSLTVTKSGIAQPSGIARKSGSRARPSRSGSDTALTGATPVLGSKRSTATSIISSAAFVWRKPSTSSKSFARWWAGA